MERQAQTHKKAISKHIPANNIVAYCGLTCRKLWVWAKYDEKKLCTRSAVLLILWQTERLNQDTWLSMTSDKHIEHTSSTIPLNTVNKKTTER